MKPEELTKLQLLEASMSLLARAHRAERERDELRAVCRLVMEFWGSREAWGDEASVTRLAGLFAPIADAARVALGEE